MINKKFERLKIKKIKNIEIKNKKLISFVIWGDCELYNYGIYENVLIAPKIFPNWIVRVYFTKTAIKKVINKLKKFEHVELYLIDAENCSGNSMFRFFPIFNRNIKTVIFRDADSRLLLKDKIAVDEWLKSDKSFHLMRDHKLNGLFMAGMWGMKRNKLIINNKKKLLNDFWKFYRLEKWGVDQMYLRKSLYPIIKNDIITHTNYKIFSNEDKPFPSECSRFGKYPFIGYTSTNIKNARKVFNKANIDNKKKRCLNKN